MEEQLVVLVDPWQDKYDRLLEANEKLQKLNQTLEEKLLKLAEKNHAETSGLSEQIQDLTQRLVDARLYIHQLADENDRYRNDINCVIQLLQCKPSNFISPKIETLPEDLQRKILGIKNGVGSGGTKKEKKIIKVQVPTFPPTDIMYAVDKGKGKKNGDKDIVSAAIMAKVLQERENERKENRRNNCHCRYRVALPTTDKASQTMPSCTISYSEFEFYNSEPEEDEEEEDDNGCGEDDDDDTESLVNNNSSCNNDHEQHSLRSHTSRSSISSSGGVGGTHSTAPNPSGYFQHVRPDSLPTRRSDSWVLSGGGRPPGGAVPVRTTMTTTFDEIIKTSVEEEARLPTPIFGFGGNYRHRNQSSTSQSSTSRTVVQQHNQQYSNNHQSSPASSSTESEHFNNHVQHHHHHLHHYHTHFPHHQNSIESGSNGHGDANSTSSSLFTSPATIPNDIPSSQNNNCSDNSSTITASNKTASTVYCNNSMNNGQYSSYRDTPPPRSSSSSLSSPSSGLAPMSIPASALINTDLNSDIMLTSSSLSSNNASSSNAMSSACDTPSSSTSGYSTNISNGILTGMFHEPLPMPTSTSSSSNCSSSKISASSYNAPPSSSSNLYNSSMPNNVVTIRKGARLSTSHISNGSVTTTSSTGMTRSTSWNNRERVDGTGNGGGNNHGSSSSIGSSSSSGGGLGLMTNIGNHWRSTMIVHNPPRSHSTYEPLSLVSVQGDENGGQQTTFSTALSSTSGMGTNSGASPLGALHSSKSETSALCNNDLECTSDSEQPLLQQPKEPQHHVYSSSNGQPSTYLFHAYHNPQQQQQQTAHSSGNGLFSTSLVGNSNAGYTAASTTSGNTIVANSNSYYRAQKRTFWARSSNNSTSTETEI